MNIITQEQFYEKRKSSTSQTNDAEIDQAVLDIIRQVKDSGDAALYELTAKLDGAELEQLAVSEAEFTKARNQVSQSFIDVLEAAKANITAFHEAQKENSWFINQADNIMLGQKVTPIEKVGVYVPGGKAAYPSTVLMNVIPAKLAGVKQIAITTPPQADGKISAEVLVAAQIAGVDTVYKVGGAQAIAALAYGTESIDNVYKIVGPGNAYVARAKKWVFGDVAIDMIAGPSEIYIVADENAPASFVAADLLSQAEHDERATSICVTTSKQLAEAVQAAVKEQTALLDRKSIIEKSLEQNGAIILVENLEEAFAVLNDIAPEHLQLMIQNPNEHLAAVQNAGAIFLGNYSPEPLGDYFAGPNHTLPTAGTAKFSSPLGVYDFVKKSSIIQYSRTGLDNAADSITTLANAEQLTAHAKAIQIRKDDNHA